jgi:hypothetical protein
MNIFTQLAQTTYDYSYTTTSSELDPTVAAAAAGTFFVIWFLLLAGLYVVSAIFLGKILKKAGVPAWIAWVPFYNNWKLLEIGGQKGFWAVLTIVPIVQYVSIVFMFIAMYNIGLKLGKSGSFVLLAIFLPLVWMIWLAVDKSTWNESASHAPSLAKETSAITPTPTVPTQPTL